MTIKIPLTQGSFALIDEQDFVLVTKHRWFVCGQPSHLYAATNVPGNTTKQRKLYMHKLILGVDGKATHGDHVNGDTLDNRRTNLRVATPSQNQYNRGISRNNNSGFKGVCYAPRGGKPWRADIGFQGTRKFLGQFHTAEEAHAAYAKAAEALHGEFARVV